MSTSESTGKQPKSKDTQWYDLFSRGARDWLRHNDKVREAVKRSLPDLVAESGVMTGDGSRTVQVPVRFLEHYRFRLRDAETETGIGQGQVKPGDVLRPARSRGEGQDRGSSGHGDGGLEFVIELKVDDIVDWLWEELALPNLQPKGGQVDNDEYTREGWDKRGARARLDRRRTLKEAIKRRSVQDDGPSFTNDDLRYRQLVRRQRPSTEAVVLFALDASSSMGEQDRKLAKTFFFWALQGLRRQYNRIETAYVAHTVNAWEFTEEEFFQVTAHGGTVASKAFEKVLEITETRYDPARYNIYLFYASDGENFPEDREAAMTALRSLTEFTNFVGYVETGQIARPGLETETAVLFRRLKARGLPVGSYAINAENDVWEAIRSFFHQQVSEEA